MGNSQYRRQHYITYHGYKYSPPIASPDSSGSLGIIIYFLRRKYPEGKAAKRLNHNLTTASYYETDTLKYGLGLHRRYSILLQPPKLTIRHIYTDHDHDDANSAKEACPIIIPC